jgi:hypothetical protein
MIRSRTSRRSLPSEAMKGHPNPTRNRSNNRSDHQHLADNRALPFNLHSGTDRCGTVQCCNITIVIYQGLVELDSNPVLVKLIVVFRSKSASASVSKKSSSVQS